MNGRLLLLTLVGFALIAPSLAIHTCNSGWDDYYDIEEDKYPVAAAEKMFAKVMEHVADEAGCTLGSSEKLEGCYNKRKAARGKQAFGEYGFGAKVEWDCDGEQQTRHIVVGVKTKRHGGFKIDYLYNEDASEWPTD